MASDMTDEARQRAETVGKAVSISPPSCYCLTIDFTDWPEDVRKACSYCRQIDVIQAYGDREYRRGLEAAAKAAWKFEHGFDIEWWMTMTKKEIAAAYCREMAAMLDRLAQEARRT